MKRPCAAFSTSGAILQLKTNLRPQAFFRGHRMKHHLLPVSPKNVQWGYFSKKIAPALTLKSGDRATIETLTHHANDDYERMIAGDPGAESVFHWTREHKAIVRRGAGPVPAFFRISHAVDAAIFTPSPASSPWILR